MSQFYSDPRREAEPTALPDVEVFRAWTYECGQCGNVSCECGDYYGVVCIDCAECGAKRSKALDMEAGRYWYWPCFPGCLPDSDPIGPFDTEAEAIADAQENACID